MFFVGDSAGHCLPLSGEGIRTAFYFGIAAGRELRAVLDGEQSREQALERLRRVLAPPRPRVRLRARAPARDPAAPAARADRAAALMGRERPCRRAFNWYLAIAPPE